MPFATARSHLRNPGTSLIAQGQSASDAWVKAAKLLADAGSDAYKAAQAKDAKALAAVTARIDASCTNCHKRSGQRISPRGGSK